MEKMSASESNRLRGQSHSWQRTLTSRRLLRTLAGAFVFIVTLKFFWSFSFQSHLPIASPSDFYLQRGLFRSLKLSGFANTGNPGEIQCQQLRHDGEIQVQQSFHLGDDLLQVAKELDGHPMVNYSGQDQRLTFEQMVEKTWGRMAASSVWLEKYQVYLTITRVFFYDKGIRHWSVISFLRGQIYDQNWNELKDYPIQWHGDVITFPTTFKIPTPYKIGDPFFGPEDPRVIIEEGVEDAEPVIVFNMLMTGERTPRAMYMFRPFSNDLAILTINGQEERPESEKNWAPFFYNPGHHKYPSKYIHFIYTFNPLRILKCHLLNGYCDWAYKQDVPKEFLTKHNDTLGRMSGGTNFVQVPVPSAMGTVAYVGFPRTHIKAGCQPDAMYRPELMVMTASSDSHFHLDFMSDSIDFGSAVMTADVRSDPCGEGRIVIANSIARWDRTARQDVMTISLSVADHTVQTMRIHGILNFIKKLPYFAHSLTHEIDEEGETMWDLRWSAVGKDVLGCSIESAQNYSIALAKPVKGMSKADLKKISAEE